MPTSILLLTAGALLGDGELSFWQFFGWSLLGAVTGDHLGYAAGRLAGGTLRGRISGWPSALRNLERAEAFSRKWGDGSVFFSRWLVSPLGPWINLTSGLSLLPLFRFSVADVTGEVLWIGGYLYLGSLFAGSISDLAEIFANAAWMIGAGAVTVVLGWQLAVRFGRAKSDAGRSAGKARASSEREGWGSP